MHLYVVCVYVCLRVCMCAQSYCQRFPHETSVVAKFGN